MATRSARISNLLEWGDIDRCRLLIAITFLFVAAYALRASYLLAHPGLEPYYDRNTLAWLRDGLAAASGFWILFLAWGSIERRRAGPHTMCLLVGSLSWWLAIGGIAYALGPITSPAWIAVLIGGVFHLLLLPRSVALFGIGVGMALVVGSLVAVMAGLIPYAPVLLHPPMVASQMALSYALGNTIVSVLATLLVLGVMGYVVTQWRKTLAHLQQVNVDLEKSVEERTRELTWRQRAEEALQASEERYRLLAENAGDIVCELDSKGRYEYVSPNYQLVLGYAPADLHERRPGEFIHPKDREEVRGVINRIVASGLPETKTYRFRHRDGEWRWFESYGKAFVAASGNTHVVVISRDITERKRTEEQQRKLEAQVRQTQKLESLGVLAGGIAHDFNNLLLPILGNARLLEAELAPESPAHRFIGRLETAALRASELTNELLAYAGRRKLAAQHLDLRVLLREMGELLQTAISRKIELRYELSDFLSLIEGDPAQLRQVIMNLITNASDAIGDQRGVITVSTGTMQANRRDLSETHLGSGLAEGPYVYLDVRDTGCGMDEATKEKIFDPFFTTKFTGRGLGLAALLGIVRAHHGTLKVESEARQGTRFRVLFPSATEAQTAVGAEAPAPARWHGSGTILVVDDEEAVRQLLEEVIPRYGMSVMAAKDGREAVERFRKHAPEIAAVLLDLTMPEIGGVEAFLEIRKIRPEARIIVSSGYGEGDFAERFAGKEVNAFLQKPYPPEELIEKLRQVLES